MNTPIPGLITLDDGSKALNLEVFVRHALSQPEVLTREKGFQRDLETLAVKLLDHGDIPLATALHLVSCLRAGGFERAMVSVLFTLFKDLHDSGELGRLPKLNLDPRVG